MISIETLLESLHFENDFFKENQSLYLTAVYKHQMKPGFAKKSIVFKEDADKLFPLFDKVNYPDVHIQIIQSSDDELSQTTPEFKSQIKEE